MSGDVRLKERFDVHPVRPVVAEAAVDEDERRAFAPGLVADADTGGVTRLRARGVPGICSGCARSGTSFVNMGLILKLIVSSTCCGGMRLPPRFRWKQRLTAVVRRRAAGRRRRRLRCGGDRCRSSRRRPRGSAAASEAPHSRDPGRRDRRRRVRSLRRARRGSCARRWPGSQDAVPPGPARFENVAEVVGMGAVDHVVGGRRSAASMASIASASGWPVGSRPSVSTVRPIETGTPAALAPRARCPPPRRHGSWSSW